jgi:RimJ/RimL family protein N-acetyltransferase
MIARRARQPSRPLKQIRTRRLRLVALDARLAHLQLDDLMAFFVGLGVRACPAWPPPLYDRDAQSHTACRLAAAPKEAGWHSWVFIGVDPPLDPALPEEVLIGAGGFHGPPDAAGVAEIGYAILPEHQRLGFAAEAAGGLIRWALTQPGVRAVRGRTLADGYASQRVLQKLGFSAIPAESAEIRAFLRRRPRFRLPQTLTPPPPTAPSTD